MEAVEVVDPTRGEVVDEVRLSTAARRVRVFAVAPDPGGKLLYLRGSWVGLSTDRFEPEEFEVLVYDLEAHELRETFRFPESVELGFFDALVASSDGASLFAIGADVRRVHVEDRIVVATIPLSRPRASGCGPIVPIGLFETEPGIWHGLYSTTDPFLPKTVKGIVKIDLEAGEVESFELGPGFEADVLALSQDGEYAYAGARDLVKIDLTARRIVAVNKNFEQGRTNNTILVSSDGTKLFVAGVGDFVEVVDTGTLERMRTIPVGGDIMTPPLALPSR